MKKSGRREFGVIVHRDEEGFYVASVPELRGCRTQARSLDKLMQRIREAITREALSTSGRAKSKFCYETRPLVSLIGLVFFGHGQKQT